jgi:DNA-binding FrmR family transcriptional regulator
MLPLQFNAASKTLFKQHLAGCFSQEEEAEMSERTIPLVVDMLREKTGIAM